MQRKSIAIFVAITSGSLLLSACISRQEMLVRHRAACVTYGFTPGTEQYSNCLLQLDVGDYGYSHHGRRPMWFQGGPGLPPNPPAPQQHPPSRAAVDNPASSAESDGRASNSAVNGTSLARSRQAHGEQVLRSSTPADGGHLSSPPDNLVLNFNLPVRLEQVTVASPGGETSPMMVTAAGFIERYSIPMTGLERGAYTVTWEATGKSGEHFKGDIKFSVR